MYNRSHSFAEFNQIADIVMVIKEITHILNRSLDLGIASTFFFRDGGQFKLKFDLSISLDSGQLNKP